MRQAWSRPLLDPGGSYDERQITHLPRNLFISEIGGIAKRRKRSALLVITSVDTSAHSLREAASKQDLECCRPPPKGTWGLSPCVLWTVRAIALGFKVQDGDSHLVHTRYMPGDSEPCISVPSSHLSLGNLVAGPQEFLTQASMADVALVFGHSTFIFFFFTSHTTLCPGLQGSRGLMGS